MFNFLGQPANQLSQVPVTMKQPSMNRGAAFVRPRTPTPVNPLSTFPPNMPMNQLPQQNMMPQQNMFNYLGRPANPLSQVPFSPMNQQTSSFRQLMPGIPSSQTNRTFMNSPSLFNTGFGR